MRAPDPGQAFVAGTIDTAVGAVPRVGTRLTAADKLGAWRVRWGIGRDDYKVDPGLYAVGSPDADSPVLVTANYKLTFDVVRSSLDGLSAWVLVLDTRGINVWCAAGKGTFSTDELVGRVRFSRLDEIVGRKRLVVPQLGATGVAAHEVRRLARFNVVWGPVLASDIPAFLAAGMKATPEMRTPTFTVRDRLVLAPVELVGTLRPLAWVLLGALALALAFVRPLTPAALALAVAGSVWRVLLAVLAGAVLTPLLLPWLPPRMFAAKGALVGALVAVACVLAIPMHPLTAASTLLLLPAVTSFVAMNFTGSTPFTSLSGVEREMRRWLPLQIGGFALAVAVTIAKGFVR